MQSGIIEILSPLPVELCVLSPKCRDFPLKGGTLGCPSHQLIVCFHPHFCFWTILKELIMIICTDKYLFAQLSIDCRDHHDHLEYFVLFKYVLSSSRFFCFKSSRIMTHQISKLSKFHHIKDRCGTFRSFAPQITCNNPD